MIQMIRLKSISRMQTVHLNFYLGPRMAFSSLLVQHYRATVSELFNQNELFNFFFISSLNSLFCVLQSTGSIGSHRKSSFHPQSLASSCSDQLNQINGPIHISRFQQQSLASSSGDQLSRTSGPVHNSRFQQQSLASSSGDQLNQTSRPVYISQFQQQIRVQQPPQSL